MNELDRQQVTKLLAAQGITIETLERPTQGMINQTLIVNQIYVLRIDIFIPERTPSRYLGEARAYTLLKQAGLPVPQIITVDVSCSAAPVPYTLMTRLPGTPLMHVWKTLSADEQASLARQCGALMAQMHDIPMTVSGWLSNLDVYPLSSPLELTETFFHSFMVAIRKQSLFDYAFQARFIGLWERVRPLIAEIKEPHLIHRDFQFENILVQDGQVTGLIDFEWGAVGDPAWDFMIDRQREYQCPGSVSHFYEGYQSRRALPPHLDILSRFYLFTLELDMAVSLTNSTGYISLSTIPRLISLLNELEAMSF